ncbi:hypothetical protein [Kitasatospora purpeofusca]|uniref:hypothetical protein n=1 Tax=Kitasatospora purpeofusca TaxID=67352 RepID=UPI00225BEDBC|nr:hypothetical protein [Kitasatospora purpeofusca]MCX4754323.1 hypothetical protein [Kitasatospora purpeofusca]WSR33751.1 hypothetical protein OG715_23910 [Kitasatospora purpeofusca]
MPTKPQTARNTAVGRSALAGAALIGLQLVAFASWPVGWTVPVAIAAALFLAFGMKVDVATDEDEEKDSLGGIFVSLGVTAVSCLLLLIVSPMPWWGVLILSWVMGPVLLGLQKPLVRGLSQAFTRHRTEVQTAVSAGLVNATLATGLLTGTRLPALITVLLGALAWTAASTLLTVLLPSHPPIDPRPTRRTSTGG